MKKNPWLIHVEKFRKKNPDMLYKEVLQKAKKTYSKKKMKGGNDFVNVGEPFKGTKKPCGIGRDNNTTFQFKTLEPNRTKLFLEWEPKQMEFIDTFKVSEVPQDKKMIEITEPLNIFSFDTMQHQIKNVSKSEPIEFKIPSGNIKNIKNINNKIQGYCNGIENKKDFIIKFETTGLYDNENEYMKFKSVIDSIGIEVNNNKNNKNIL